VDNKGEIMATLIEAGISPEHLDKINYQSVKDAGIGLPVLLILNDAEEALSIAELGQILRTQEDNTEQEDESPLEIPDDVGLLEIVKAYHELGMVYETPSGYLLNHMGVTYVQHALSKLNEDPQTTE
jgi:hypothetical protein